MHLIGSPPVQRDKTSYYTYVRITLLENLLWIHTNTPEQGRKRALNLYVTGKSMIIIV